MPPRPIPRCLSRCSTAPTPAAMSTPIAAIPPPNGSETETGRLACAYPAQRQRHQGHLRYTKEAQPPYRHAARPCRTRVRRADANGRQAGAMHGYRPRHLRLAAQGGKLQPETAGVPEGRRIGTVLNDPRRYEPPADRQVYSCATSFPCIPPRPIRPPKFVIGSLRNSSRRQKQVIRGRLLSRRLPSLKPPLLLDAPQARSPEPGQFVAPGQQKEILSAVDDFMGIIQVRMTTSPPRRHESNHVSWSRSRIDA